MRSHLLIVVLLSGCLSPLRPEPPTPRPAADPFADLEADCRDAEVVDEMSSALAPTLRCLERPDAHDCLVSISRLLMRSTIACAVSRNGAEAAVRLEAGDDSRRHVARVAKEWVFAHRIRFK